MAYYGLSYGAGDLPGDIFVNNVINGAVEVAAYVASFFLLNVLGRRMLTAGPLLFSGVCMIGGMLLVYGLIYKESHPNFMESEDFLTRLISNEMLSIMIAKVK
jgi:hypothetical protein